MHKQRSCKFLAQFFMPPCMLGLHGGADREVVEEFDEKHQWSSVEEEAMLWFLVNAAQLCHGCIAAELKCVVQILLMN